MTAYPISNMTHPNIFYCPKQMARPGLETDDKPNSSNSKNQHGMEGSALQKIKDCSVSEKHG